MPERAFKIITGISFSGKWFKSVSYGLTQDGSDIDYEQVARLAKECKPKILVCGFSSFSGIINWEKFQSIADEVGAYCVADMSHVSGLVAAKLYPSPVNVVDVTTTTTHKTLRGPRSGLILARSNPDLEKKINSSVFPDKLIKIKISFLDMLPKSP